MKIVNFNRTRNDTTGTWSDTFRAWNKEYCHDLNRKINSLYDYINWNYPQYVIFNAENGPDVDTSYIEDDYEVVCMRYSTITNEWIRVTDVTLKTIFFTSKLNYHQGIYNQSNYGDGYICLPVAATHTIPYLTTNFGWVLPEGVTPDYIMYIQNKGAWILDEQEWIKIKTTTANGKIYYTTKGKLPDGGQFYMGYNFLNGYICILNKQPIGKNNQYNSVKTNILSYLIAPIGNGGYYNIWWDNNDLKAEYEANELGKFSNKISINLARNCRYIIPALYQFKNNGYEIDIQNYDSNNNKYITDMSGNLWSGQKELVGEIVNSNLEPILCDVLYDVYVSIENFTKIHHFVADTSNGIKTDHKLLIY